MTDLKEQVGKEDPKVTVKEEGKEIVTVSKTQLDALIKNNKSLSERLETLETRTKPKVATKIKESFGRMRKWEDKYVVEDIKNVREKILLNEIDEKEKFLVCDVVVGDGENEPETIKDVRYLKFLEEAEVIDVEIVENEKKEISEFVDPRNPMIAVKKYEEKGDSIGMKEVGTIQNVVTSPKTTLTVKLPDGKKIKLSNNALNI